MSCEEDWHDLISAVMQRKNVWKEKKKKNKKRRRDRTVAQEATNFSVNKELGEKPSIQ